MSGASIKSFAAMVVVLFLMVPFVAMAQSTTDGAIGGTVVDQSKAVVPGAKITIVNLGTNFSQSVTADPEGRFRVIRLQPGTYSVSVEAASFAGYKRQGVVVEVGRVTELELMLTAGAKSETVEVTGEAPTINTVQQDFSTNINQVSINELPINGRRWSNFALLTPGASPDGDFGLISFRGISGLLNNNTVDGGDNNQAFFGEERGRTRISYVVSQASVREFQVNTSNFSAEYGRAAGAVVNAVTKSGTNNYHGTAFYYIRDNELGATNAYTKQPVLENGVYVSKPVKPTDRRQQFGGTFGGPIVKDSLFFFFSYDQQKRNFPGVALPDNPGTFFGAITVADPVASGRTCASSTRTDGEILYCNGVTQTQANAGLAFLTSLSGVVPRTGDQTIVFPKLDWKINTNNTLAISYNRMRWKSPAGVQTQPVVSRGVASFGDDGVKVDSLTARLNSAINNNITNEARFQFGRDFEFQLSQPPAAGEVGTGVGGRMPSVSVASAFTFGKPNFLERRAQPDEYRTQIADTMSVVKGTHLVKFGFDLNRVNDKNDNLFREGGEYSYNSRGLFITDYIGSLTPGYTGRNYSSFRQAFGPRGFNFVTWDYAFFVQDDWRVLPRLTLNLGVRYEYQQLPKPQLANTKAPDTLSFPKDQKNFGPRIGFALDVFGDGKTSLRGGYGMYYGRLINSTIANAITKTGSPNSQIETSFSNTTGPIYPNVMGAGTIVATPDIVVIDRNWQNPLIHQADLVLEREIAANTVLSVSWLYSHGTKLVNFADVNLNRPTSTITYTVVGGPYDGDQYTIDKFTGARPNPAFGKITSITSNVESDYNGLAIQLNRRMSNGLQFQINHTWSHAIDNGQNSTTFTPTFGNSMFNVFNPDLDRANSNYDFRHKFTASVVWQPQMFKNNGKFTKAVLDGWSIAPIVSISSGRPYSGTLSGNAPGTRTTFGVNGSDGSNQAVFVGRNAFRYPHTENVDLRVSRRFKIREGHSVEMLGEAFNLFNRRNITSVASRMFTIGGTSAAPTLTWDPTFGTPTAAGNTVFRERQVQFAVRYEF